VKQACSRTIQTSGANRFVRGAHHRRCAREGLTEPYNAQSEPQVQARDDYMSLTGYILRRQYILDMVHILLNLSNTSRTYDHPTPG